MGAAATIRPATTTDSVNILRLLRDGWAESAGCGLGEFDEPRVLDYVNRTLKHAFALVVERSGRIIASAAIAPARLPVTEKPVMVEAWFAVAPRWRESDLARRLLSALEQLCDCEQIALLWGTSCIAPAALDEAVAHRPEYVRARQTYLRLPALKVAAA